jgi:hypothetical protein
MSKETYAKIQQDLIDTKDSLINAISSLINRGESLDKCEKKSALLLEESERFHNETNDTVYANKLSRLFYEKIVPFLGWLWITIKYYTMLIVWQEPCKIYFDNSFVSVHLRVKDKIEQI